MNETDVKVLKRGLKRLGIALLTALTYAVAAFGFILVFFVKGYLAVLLFAVSCVTLAIAVTLMYGQGMNVRTESKGESK